MLTACPSCQKVFDPLTGGYAPDATIVCVDCAVRLKAQAQTTENKQQGSAFVGSIGSILIALMSFIIEHKFIYFLLPLMAIGFGGGTAWTALTNPVAGERLGAKRVPTIGFGLLGTGLGVLSLVARVTFGE